MKKWMALLLAMSMCACSVPSEAQAEPELQRDFSTAEIVVEYGILDAKLIHSAPTGVTFSGKGDLLLEPGKEIGGAVLTEAFLEEFEFSVTGPKDGEQIQMNGVTACHNTAFALLYGEIVEVDGQVVVNPENTQLTIYTIPSSVGMPTYCRALSGEILTFDDPYAFESALESKPEQFL